MHKILHNDGIDPQMLMSVRQTWMPAMRMQNVKTLLVATTAHVTVDTVEMASPALVKKNYSSLHEYIH